MTHKEFVIWLHGFLEISEAKELTEKQLQIVKDHLDLFFDKKTPDRKKEEKSFKIEEMVSDPNVFKRPITQCTCGQFNNIACPLHGRGGLGDNVVMC